MARALSFGTARGRQLLEQHAALPPVRGSAYSRTIFAQTSKDARGHGPRHLLKMSGSRVSWLISLVVFEIRGPCLGRLPSSQKEASHCPWPISRPRNVGVPLVRDSAYSRIALSTRGNSRE